MCTELRVAVEWKDFLAPSLSNCKFKKIMGVCKLTSLIISQLSDLGIAYQALEGRVFVVD